MLLLFGLLLLRKPLSTEGCSANQHSSASLTADNDVRLVHNATLTLPLNSTCQWDITAPEGKVVRIDVLVFNFSLPCDKEYLRIHDGPGKSSKMLIEYCLNGSTQPHSVFYSSGRSLWLETKKGLTNSTSGSIMVLYSAREGCRENHNSTTSLTAGEDKRLLTGGLFMLPSNSTCQWNITAPEGKGLRIDVYIYDFDLPCDNEYLRILDGPEESSEMLTEYCVNSSRNRYAYFYSSGRSLWLESMKGMSNSNSRFRFYYEAIDFKGCSINTTLNAPLSPVKHNFSSPYYPEGYPMNKTCEWYITAPVNRTVVLHLKYRMTSSKDTVEVYDVAGTELSLVSVFGRSWSEKTATVYSKYHRLYVLFKSDDEKDWAEKGFFVSYTAITPGHSCSSGNSLDRNQNIVVKDPSGVIKTPGYPSNYPENLLQQCYWKIYAPEGKLIKLDFTSFRLPRGTCVVVINAINKEIPMRITHCVEQPSFVVYSMTNELGIMVREHYGLTGPGFTANYALVTADLSGTCRPSENSTVNMASEGMSFASQGYPLHPGNGSCNWNISVPSGNFIKLTFWFVVGPCNHSYVEVHDVTNSTWVSLGKFCTIGIAREVYSKGNNLLVTYVTTLPASGGGFFASYETVPAVPASYACSTPGGFRIQLSGTGGDLASYLYPRPYANDASCRWTIEAPLGYMVKLTFHSFDLQQSQNCSTDYVQIKQGKYYHDAKELGRFCGSSLPGVIMTNQTKMYVDFVVDSSGRYPGFHASYVAVENPAMGACKTQGIDNIIPLSGKTGQLFSPMYPQTFPHKMTCTWTISVPEGNYVRLRITSFFLAFVCKEGTKLEIRDGQSSKSDLLKTFCGPDYEPSVFSSGRYLWVRFQSSDDIYQYGSGFNALFEAVTQLPASFSCTAPNRVTKLKSESGTLASYNYPLPYDDSVECVWSINVDTDYKIVLSFQSFNLSNSADCSEDYVEVRDGLFSTSELVGKYCGSEKPSEITSDSWDLRVAFKSSGKTKYPGFKATYETKKAANVTFILKIVGICLGALSFVFLVISSCIACYKKNHNQGQPGMVLQGTDNSANVAHDRGKETTGL